MTALSAAGMGAIFGLDRVRALLDSDDAGVHRAPGLQDDHVQQCCGRHCQVEAGKGEDYNSVLSALLSIFWTTWSIFHINAAIR